MNIDSLYLNWMEMLKSSMTTREKRERDWIGKWNISSRTCSAWSVIWQWIVSNDRLGTKHNDDEEGDWSVMAVSSFPMYNQDWFVKSNKCSMIDRNLNERKTKWFWFASHRSNISLVFYLFKPVHCLRRLLIMSMSQWRLNLKN